MTEQAMELAEAAASGMRIVTAAVGRRVVCRTRRWGFGHGQHGGGEGREVHGVYQVDGRVLEDETKRAVSVTDFVAFAGWSGSGTRPLRKIRLERNGTGADEAEAPPFRPSPRG